MARSSTNGRGAVKDARVEIPRLRIVPDAYKAATLHLEGVTPLLLHADTLLDITNPLTRQFRTLTTKASAQRTIDDEMMIAKVEWLAGMYHDDEVGPYVPGRMLKRAITEAATRFLKGEPLNRGLVILADKIPVEYEGPRGLEELWEANFVDMQGAVNSGRNKGRVMRCRPKFEEWAITAELAWDPGECDYDTLEKVIEFAQVRGIGDGRRIGYGTFEGTLEPAA